MSCTNNGTVYELSGPKEASVVVLVHGLGLNRYTWQWHEAALSARYRVLNYDLFGHGESAAPPVAPSLSLFATQLYDLIDFIGIESCTIVGFSLGGMINRRFALDYADRVHGLAILNSPHERSSDAQREVEERAAQSAQGGPEATLDATLERWFTPNFRTVQPEIMNLVRGWVINNDPVIYAQCRQVLARGVVELIRPSPPIVQPTLVMTAENDSGSTPAMAYAIASEIPGSKTIIVPKLQHMALVEAPDQFIEPLLRFLEK